MCLKVSMQSRQNKSIYTKHTEGGFPLGKSSCQQAMSMEIVTPKPSHLFNTVQRFHQNKCKAVCGISAAILPFHDLPQFNYY